MIKALGVDVVDVSRIEGAMASPRFIAKILTPREQELCPTPQQVAGRWAAKEAVMKCLSETSTFLDIEILRGSRGEPVVVRPSGLWLVSISHEKGLAVAVAALLAEDC